MPITADQIVPELLRACPSAKDRWDEHLARWGDDERGHYNDVDVFAHHVVDSYVAGNVDELAAFFALLERLVAEGDADVVELATIGLIEVIQNVASHRSCGFRVFEGWLGPASRVAWTEVEEMWRGKRSLADMVRYEAGTKKPRWWQLRRRLRRKKAIDIDAIQNPELRALVQSMHRTEDTKGSRNDDGT